MARDFAGVAYGTANAGNVTTLLSASAGFTVVLWCRPNELLPAFVGPLLVVAGGGNIWQLKYTTAGKVEFDTTNHTGTDPKTVGATSATAVFSTVDATHGKRVLYRYDGTTWVVWTASKTAGIAKKTISASVTFALPTISGGTAAIGSDGVDAFDGAIAEVGVYDRALDDADCERLLRGVACDQIGGGSLRSYWPIRGTGVTISGTTYEPDYVDLPNLFAGGSRLAFLGTAAAEAHPDVYGLDDPANPYAAWCAEIQHADGTIYIASADLGRPVDVDVLGRVYQHRILNGESVVVAKTINDGIVSPGSTTLVVANDQARSPADVAGLACWLEADQIRTVADGAAVTTWPDMSGRGIDATDATGPTYDADGMNSLPALLFDAGGEAMTLASALPTTSAAPYTMVVVFSRADAAASTHTIMAAPSGGWILYTDSSNVCKVDIGTGGTLTLGSVTELDRAYVATLIFDGANCFARLNGATFATGTQSIHPTAAPIIGANSGGSLDLDGRVSLVAVYSRVLDAATELAQIENYAAAKYGAAINHGTLSPRREWRGTRVILRRYERTSHELVAEMVGKIADVDWSRPGKAAITITGAASDVLDTRIPKALVNVDEHASATDLLAPIPVGFGDFWVSAPYIGRDETGSPGTADFAVSHAVDADGNAFTLDVRRVLFDIATGGAFPGLEEATSWAEVGGTVPTRISDTVIALSGNFSQFYEPGMPVRVTHVGGEYYTHVVSYDTGTNRVTLADAVVLFAPSKVELLAGGYIVQKDEYTSGGEDIATIRFVGTGFGGGVVVFGQNTYVTNPADVIKEILRNPVWGLGQTVDSAAHFVAGTTLSSAGLGDSCHYALGGDRQQRSARQVLSELLSIRGGWLDLQPDGTWGMYFDRTPVWSQSRTFAVADRRFPQIQAITAHNRTPLGALVGKLKLRYRKKGRSRTNEGVTSWLAPSDYEFQNNYTVSTVGADRVVTNPWLDRATNAGRVVVYQGKRLKVEDEKLEIRVGPEGRNVELGEVVRLVIPHSQVDGDYRVTGYTRGLAATTLRTVGYSSSIFDFNASEVGYDAASGVNTSADTIDTDQTTTPPVAGANQILNPNFALGFGNTYTPATTNLDATTLPGWIISEVDAGSTAISALSILRNAAWVGRYYVQATIASVSGDPQLRTNANLSSGVTIGGLVVEPGKAYIVSAYITETSATKPADAKGFRFHVEWYQADGSASAVEATVTPKLRSANQLTGPDTEQAMRWWCAVRAPSDAAYARLNIQFTATGTYQVGAVAWNQVNRFLWAPPPWSLTADS